MREKGIKTRKGRTTSLGFTNSASTSNGLLAAVLIVIGALTMLVSALHGQTPDLAEKSHHAKELIDSGKPAEAVPIYRELVRAMPNNPGFIMDLGLALDMSGNKPEAIREYQNALKLDSGDFPALVLLGTAYLDLGQPAKALDPLERSVRMQPDNFSAAETLAEALFALGRLGEAERRFRELSQLDATNSKVWYALGLCYEGLAQKNFDELAKAAPGSAYWLDLVAESRLQNKQDYSAFYFYRQALAKMPGMRGVHAAIAVVYEDAGHSDWAVVERQKEQALPAPDCSVEKLECDFQARRFLEIVDSAHAAKGAATYYWRTRAYNKLALDAYVRLGGLPPSMESHELKAKIDSDRRQFAEAAKEWDEALALSPDNAYVEKQLGVALYKSGDVAGAQTLFERLLKWQPDAADLNFYLGDTLLHAQKPQDALPFLEKALLREPALLPAQQAMGLAYMQTGQPAKAIPHLKGALSIDEDGSLRYQLARAYQISGQKELASAMLREYQKKQQAVQKENAGVEKEVALTPPQ
ncbi:MAG TPA: tetratricopeptide repeat protein [Terriglobia bacterium]|nr:tetratricopeptide repeat protein [Terriglobia bacterium]